jgi:hypothetical protein
LSQQCHYHQHEVAEEEAEAVDFHRMLLVAGLVAAAARLKILGVANNIKEKKKKLHLVYSIKDHKGIGIIFFLIWFLFFWGMGGG